MSKGVFSEQLNTRISVQAKNGAREILLRTGESLMDGLLREGFYVSALCGGKGRCGKCKVKVLSGNVPVSSEDKKFFTDAQLEEGWRLSCRLVPSEDLTISFEAYEEAELEAVSQFRENIFSGEDGHEDVKANWEQGALAGNETDTCVIAVDIGTTTIALQLLNERGRVLGTETRINSQRKYGADVVTRIQAAIDGIGNILQESIRRDLQSGILSLLENTGQTLERIRKVAIACNTTMSHLLMGYDCAGLGVYPYTPVNIATISGTVKDIIGLPSEAAVVILPGISTYVGGDIVSGLYACDFYHSDEVCLLVDLGTNGEMALGNRERLLVTSTAAGPAFEGGNLTWGTGSVAGAICSVSLTENDVCTEQEQQADDCMQDCHKIHIGTISNQSPVGICGTGVVETIAELHRMGLLDETGLLEENYFEEGFPLAKTRNGETIVLTQKDIRELQLAKAAVRAGIETLCLRYGVAKEQVSKVYLAGGFGYRLDVKKAIAIGMLPGEFAGKVEAVGNSSLAGAVKLLRENGPEKCYETENSAGNDYAELMTTEKRLLELVSISEEIGLAEDEDFNDFYMEYMMFE